MRIDHGTANDAIEWLLWVNNDFDPANDREFLKAWEDGSAEEEWPEYYAWLDTRGEK